MSRLDSLCIQDRMRRVYVVPHTRLVVAIGASKSPPASKKIRPCDGGG